MEFNINTKTPYIIYGIIIFGTIALFFLSSHHSNQETKLYINETNTNENIDKEDLNIMNITLGEVNSRSIDMQIEKNIIASQKEEKIIHDIVEKQIYKTQSIAFGVFLVFLGLIYYYSVIEEQKYKNKNENKEIENTERNGYILIDNMDE